MKKTIYLFGLWLLGSAIAAMAVPPKVVQAVPDTSTTNVDPNLRELRVVFDQPMSQGGRSIVGGGQNFPKFVGAPRWENDRTFVSSWKLKSDHDYWLSINSDKFQNFRSQSGESAEPHPISFHTGPGGTNEPNGPVVLSSVPDNGSDNVDPDLDELRVVFDQPMSHGGWSVVGGGPKFPKFVGNARWTDDRTFVWQWKLEAEHEYWLSINNATFCNFQSASGEPAEPHPIAFRTRTSTNPASAFGAVALNRAAFEILRKAIDEDYSYRDLRKVNWTARFAEYGPKLQSADSAWEFAHKAAEMLAPAQDTHLWIKLGDEQIPTYRRQSAWNVATSKLSSYVPDWQKRNAIIASGRFEDGIRYMQIRSWPANRDDLLDPAFDILNEAMIAGGKALIIDVRANGGGAEPAAAKVAGCFVKAPVVYGRDVIRRNGKLSEPLDRTLVPTEDRPKYRGRVVVLAGLGTISSCESFVLMMKQVPGCVVIGDRTAGSSGNPKPINLGNGVTVFIPSWQDLRLDGTCFEGEGIAPDIAVKCEPKDFDTHDPVLDAALKVLRAD